MSAEEQGKFFEMPPQQSAELGQVPAPIETATFNAIERATAHVFGENFDEMGDPSKEITPQDVTTIVHLALAELAKEGVLKLKAEDYEEEA